MLRFNPDADLPKTSVSVKHFLKYFFFVMVVAAACNDDSDSIITESGLDYFPLQTGNYYIYNIDETIYSEVAPVQNKIYQMKVEVMDSFPTPDGTYTYVLSRMTRDNETDVWLDLDTWSTRANNLELVVNEGNTPYLKLVFPLHEGKEWNGNKYNNFGEDKYQLTSFGEPFELEETNFENTLTVTQENNDDVIVYHDIRKEVYAKDIGLVYREIMQLSYCTNNDCLGQQIIKSGKIYKQQLDTYVVQ